MTDLDSSPLDRPLTLGPPWRCPYCSNVNRDRLFVEKVDWLARVVEKPTSAELLIASGQMRLLLLDEQPLLHQVNASRNFDIRFRMVSQREGPPPGMPPGFVLWASPVGVSPELSRGINHGFPTLTLKLPAFLQERIMIYKGEDVTVRELIRFTSHVAGGIHAGTVEKEGGKAEILAELAELMLLEGTDIPTHSLRGVTAVVAEALHPLRDAIAEGN